MDTLDTPLNRVELTASLIERRALRYTPAGVPVVEAIVGHRSEQEEAGRPRSVVCEVAVVALGETARWLDAAKPGVGLQLSGFLAARSQSGKSLRLHLTSIEFVEGN